MVLQNASAASAHTLDIAHVVHPYADAREREREGPLIIKRGEGIYVFDEDGRQYIEGLAGLWSVAVGFGEPRLADAAAKQMRQLSYYHTFGNKSHDPCIELAAQLTAMAPPRLQRVFFTNSGSEANDSVVKFVWFYNNALGRPNKRKIISRQRAYHGVTVASASMTGLPANHGSFNLPLPGFLHTACPHYYRYGEPSESEAEFTRRLANAFETLVLSEGPDTVAAFIGEPLMGAGGVIPPPKGYWAAIQAICRKYDILLVADEVITGFGRLGKTFGSELYGIDPDFMVLSKQLTSSYQPLAAILIAEDKFAAIADVSARIGTLGHGFTASGHPVAAAVALENLKIIAERRLVDNANRLGLILQDGLHAIAAQSRSIGEARGEGLIGALEFVEDKATRRPFAKPGAVGRYAFARAQAHGLVVRAIGDAIAVCPPLIITEAELAELLARLRRAVEDTERWIERGKDGAPA
jgi:4-aminobutyrate--pyruvate transaminase